MQQSHDPVNDDVFICHMKWNADTNFKFIPCLDMPGAM